MGRDGKIPIPVNKRLHVLSNARDELSHNLKSLYKVKVELVMKPDFIEFKESNNLLDLLKVFENESINSAIILDNKERIVGLVTRSSLLNFFKTPVEKSKFSPSFLNRITTKRTSTIKEIMSKNPKTINKDKNLDEAIKTMMKTGKNHLPVVNEENKVEGILEINDIMTLLRIVTL